MSYSHFTLDDRFFIQHSLEDGKSHRTIAKELGVSHTAINNEIKNNSFVLDYATTTRVNKPQIIDLDLRHKRGVGLVPVKQAALDRWQERLKRFKNSQPVYDAIIAHNCYLERRKQAGLKKRKLQDGNQLANLVKTMLISKKKDSPEQIAANLARLDISISHQSIYSWIKISIDHDQLIKHLRRKGKPYKYKSSVTTWNKTNQKKSIHDRPEIVEQLTRLGDLEGDTIVGKNQKDRILTHIDRVSGEGSISLVLNYNSYKVYKQTQKDIKRVFSKVHTITYDNGPEFSAWKKTEQELKTDIYFADPYKSSQRARNENFNGLVRQFFPKGTDFKKITKKQVRQVETILNNRLRKRYNWHSPIEQRQIILANESGKVENLI